MMEERRLKRKKEKAIAEGNQDLLYHSCKELADEYLQKEENELALSEYTEAAKAAQKLGNKFYIAVTNRMIGETYCALGEFDKAILHQKFHLKYAREERDLIEEQRALATLGRTFFVQAESLSDSEGNDRAKSLSLSHQYYSKSLSICEKLPSSNQLGQKTLAEMKCRLFLNLGLTSEAEGNSAAAIEYISKGIAISKNMELWEDLYRCYTAEGSILVRQGCRERALAAYERGLQVVERCEKKTQFVCELLSLQADVLITRSEYSGAKNILIKAYKMKTPDPKDREEIEKKLKTVALIWKKEQVLLELPKSDYVSRKEVNEKLGDLCVRLNDYNKAIHHYLSTLECAQSMGFEEERLAPIYYSLSQTYKDNKQYELSVEYSRKEFDLIKNNSVEACQTLLNLCDTYELMNEPFETVMRSYKECLVLAKKSNDLKMEATVLKNMLRIQRAHGREDLAEETEQALDVIKCCLPDSQEEEIATPAEDEASDEEIDLEALIDDGCSDNDDEDPLNQDKRARRRPVKSTLTRRNEKGETPLHVASAKGNVPLIRSLVKQGHPVNIPDAAGWSPLHEACNHGQIEAAQTLIELGAKIDDRGGHSCDGITPLLDAASNGHLELITMLLDKGASPLAKTNQGDSVLDCLLACQRRAIAQGEKLDYETQAYFDRVVERLKECYDKVGQNYSTPSSRQTYTQTQRSQRHSITSLQSQTKRTNDVLSKAIDDSRRRTECKPSGSGDSVGSAKEYKEAIQALRRRNKNDTAYNEPLERVKKNALLAEEDVGDDWLDDDMQGMVQPAKRRRENFVGQQLRQPNNVTKSTPIKSPSPMLWGDGSEEMDDLLNSVDIQEPQSSRRSSSPEIQFTSFSAAIPVKEMTSCPESPPPPPPSMNFQRFRPPSSSTQTCDERSLPPSRPQQQRQASLLAMDFQRSRTPSSSPRPHEESLLQTQPQPEPPPTAISSPFSGVRAIKVRIGNKLFLVPIPQTSDSLTIGWLANEASRRYENSEGVIPALKLTTVDGALLDSNDPLSIILNDSEVHGTAMSWRSKPPSERYKEACLVASIGVDNYLEQKLEVCETSGRLDIRDRRLSIEKLNPLFKAVQHCERLQDICLSSIFLVDRDFKAFVDHILTLTSVRSLNVSVNHITHDGLSHLAEVISSGNIQSLQNLNVSYNPLGEGCNSPLRTLSQQLPSLRTLNIRCVGLTSKFLHGDWFFEFNCLENLDISFNKLDRESLSKFLASLDADKIRSMNVSHAGSCEVLREVNLFLSGGSLENLEELCLAGLDAADQDVRDLTETLLRATQLRKLNLAGNPKITVASHEHLSRLETLGELYLAGCALLRGSHQLSVTLNRLTLSSETPVNDFLEGPYNYFTSSNHL